MLIPYFVLFQNLNKHVHLKSQLDNLFHNVYIQHNLLYEVHLLFVELCSRSMVIGTLIFIIVRTMLLLLKSNIKNIVSERYLIALQISYFI